MSTVKAYIALTRPSNVLITFISVLIAAGLAGSIQPLANVLLACISASFITIAANAINDFFDIEIDKVNKPFRPLPSGKISPDSARIFSLSFFVAGIFLSVFIHWNCVIVAVGASILLYFYSARLKRTVLWGNLTVSIISAFAFIYGGLAVNRIKGAIFPAIFALLMHLGREIVKDIQDQDGDKIANANTLPLAYGVTTAKTVVTITFALLLFATIIPYRIGYYNNVYLWIVVFGVDLVILGITVILWRVTKPKHLNIVSDIIKADMVIGLLALYLGHV